MMENVRMMSDQDLMVKCQEFGKKAREWKNRFVALLPEVSRRGLHRRKGFATIIEFAAKVGGVGKSTVEAIFRVNRALADKPKLKAMVAEVGVNKVRAVASIATKENENELINLVKTMSKPALEMYVRDEKAHKQTTRPGTENVVMRERMSFSVDENIALEMRKIKLRMEKERKEAVEWNDVMCEMVKAMAIPKKKRRKKKVQVSAKKIEESRYIIAEKRHDLNDKHNGKCGHPGCNKPATEIHHIDGFAQVRNHDNLIPLCHEHHELKHYEMPESPWLANEIIAIRE